ncbi:MAG: UDP-N-acetylmuramoyl-L-alanyl-D-glutamate--2,6-diaminopimelate ligase [SAR324 cluster bacterium]|nr:UDP-N-acetylmuramoyl-L-alanyl-D-glutamate--2,6-diaminopimelate ligase [SAR324 cluster bacterium]
MRLDQIALQPAVLADSLAKPEFDLSAVQADSRRVDSATAFFALKGASHDGHRFAEGAVAAGTPALFLSERAAYDRWAGLPAGGPHGVFLVREGRQALAQLAAEIYGHPSRHLTLLGTTGTNGKTTVTHLAAQLLEAIGGRCAIIGSLGMKPGEPHRDGDLTTPEAPETQAFLRACLKGGWDTVAMEASSIGLAVGRTHGLAYRAAAFTNLTPEHLDFHGDMTSYGEAKNRLFLEHAIGRAVINLDDPAGRRLVERLTMADPKGLPPLTYTLDPAAYPQATLALEGITVGTEGMGGTMRVREQGQGDRQHPVRIPLLGRYNLSNLLAAIGLLTAAGHPPEALARAASHCRGAPGRFERVALPHPFTVIVDYAHTPDALENLLGAARELVGRGRVLLLFGCGGERDTAKRPLMGMIAQRRADRVVITSDNPRGEPPGTILDEIEKGIDDGNDVTRIESRTQAIAAILDQARAGDIVLIAGKGHEQFQDIGGRRFPFDDRREVLKWAGISGGAH